MTDKCTVGTTPLRPSRPPSCKGFSCVPVGWSDEGVRFTQPFQSFGEPGFQGAVRCSGAHGPVPPCVFQISRGRARCGVIHLPLGSDQPPSKSLSHGELSLQAALSDRNTHTSRYIHFTRVILSPPAMCDQETEAQRKGFSGEIHHGLLRVASKPNSCPLMRGK